MPYFMILPLFAIYAMTLLCAILVSSLVVRHRHLQRRLISIAGWSTAGFVVGNVVYVFLEMAIVNFAPSVFQAPGLLRALFTTFFFFGLPFLVSGLGLVGGILIAWQRGRNNAQAA